MSFVAEIIVRRPVQDKGLVEMEAGVVIKAGLRQLVDENDPSSVHIQLFLNTAIATRR
jgi:hypothetical protein